MMKKVPVSCVGVIDYDGAEDHFRLLVKLIEQQKIAFRQLKQSRCCWFYYFVIFSEQLLAFDF